MTKAPPGTRPAGLPTPRTSSPSTTSTSSTKATRHNLTGAVAATSNGKATRTYAYDAGSERRGLLTGVYDSLSGNFTAEHDADGTVAGETWPNGITVTHDHDETGTPASLTYERPGCGQPDCTIYTTAAGEDVHSQQRWTTSTLSAQTYGYDQAGRMTTVTDTVGGDCTTRTYTFSTASNRTSHTSHNPDTGGCQTSTPAASTS